jgi:hypothetical protein
MKINPKGNIEFTSFNDGVCKIYTKDEEGNKAYKFKSLCFTKRTLGYKRAFVAAASQTQIDRVIRVPKVPGIYNNDIVEIQNEGRYKIELVQEIYVTNPLTLDLTLKQLEMFEVK